MHKIVETQMGAVPDSDTAPTWALGNHDSPRVISRLGGGELGNLKTRSMFTVVAALPGAWYLYNGDELGLPDVQLGDADRQDPVFFRTKGEQKGRGGARVPMPWSGDEAPYGFSKNSYNPTWLPQPTNWKDLTVESQQQNPDSMLNFVRQLLLLRKSLTALSINSVFSWLNDYKGLTLDDGALAFTRWKV